MCVSVCSVLAADCGLHLWCAAYTLSMTMAAPLIPKGPFGNFRSASDGAGEGWVGDRSRSAQIGKFEKGEDYLFFQGPSPLYAVQPELPSVLSGVSIRHPAIAHRARPRALSIATRAQENLANALEDPPIVQLGAAAVAGVGALAVVGSVLLT